MLSAAAMTAQSVAVRDAVFLSSRDWTAILAMLLATLISLLLLVLFDTRLAHLLARATPTPAAVVAAAALFLCEWLLGPQARSMTAVIRCSLHGLQRVEITEKETPDRLMVDRRIATPGLDESSTATSISRATTFWSGSVVATGRPTLPHSGHCSNRRHRPRSSLSVAHDDHRVEA
jgi:hypothetical protein